jgi:nucleotide-binding universal stress UspA family protein
VISKYARPSKGKHDPFPRLGGIAQKACPAGGISDHAGTMEKSPHGMVVGYNGSPDSDAAVAWAARTAQLRGEQIVATILMERTDRPHGQHWPEPWWHEIEDRARQALDQADATHSRVERRAGSTVATLVDISRDASMLVVGSRGHSRIGEVLLGSVSQSAARHAHCPVVVVRQTRNPGSDRIVVGVDGSAPSLRAIDFACRQATLTGTKVVLVRAWRPLTVPIDKHGDLPASLSSRLLEEENTLAVAVADARTRHPDVALEGEFIATSPRRALVDASSNASMVVVGSRGHSVPAQTVLGSVSHDVLHRAQCPVGVVR